MSHVNLFFIPTLLFSLALLVMGHTITARHKRRRVIIAWAAVAALAAVPALLFAVYYAPLLASDIVSGLEGYNTGMLRTPTGPNGRQSTAFLSTYPAAPVPDPNGQFIGSDVDYFDPNFKVGRTV